MIGFREEGARTSENWLIVEKHVLICASRISENS
jgi:hypothetical protein